MVTEPGTTQYVASTLQIFNACQAALTSQLPIVTAQDGAFEVDKGTLGRNIGYSIYAAYQSASRAP